MTSNSHISIIASTTGILLLHALLRRISPPRPVDGAGLSPTEDDLRDFRNLERWTVLPVLFLVPIFGYSWFMVVQWAGEQYVPPVPGTLYLLRPLWLAWTIPAGFLGVLSAGVVGYLVYKASLGERYARYERFYIERIGYDARWLHPWVFGLSAAASVACFIAGATSFARFEEAGVTIGQPLQSRPTFHEYSHVKAVENRSTFVAPNGDVVDEPHYAIVFDDGSSWTTREQIGRQPEMDRRIAQLVSQRSGRPILGDR